MEINWVTYCTIVIAAIGAITGIWSLLWQIVLQKPSLRISASVVRVLGDPLFPSDRDYLNVSAINIGAVIVVLQLPGLIPSKRFRKFSLMIHPRRPGPVELHPGFSHSELAEISILVDKLKKPFPKHSWIALRPAYTTAINKTWRGRQIWINLDTAEVKHGTFFWFWPKNDKTQRKLQS